MRPGPCSVCASSKCDAHQTGNLASHKHRRTGTDGQPGVAWRLPCLLPLPHAGAGARHRSTIVRRHRSVQRRPLVKTSTFPLVLFKKKKFLLLLCSRVATLLGLFFHNKSTTSYQPVVLSEQISTNHHPPAKRTNSGSCDPILYGSDVLSERFLKSALVQH
jgi:hypothetical protein